MLLSPDGAVLVCSFLHLYLDDVRCHSRTVISCAWLSAITESRVFVTESLITETP